MARLQVWSTTVFIAFVLLLVCRVFYMWVFRNGVYALITLKTYKRTPLVVVSSFPPYFLPHPSSGVCFFEIRFWFGIFYILPLTLRGVSFNRSEKHQSFPLSSFFCRVCKPFFKIGLFIQNHFDLLDQKTASDENRFDSIFFFFSIKTHTLFRSSCSPWKLTINVHTVFFVPDGFSSFCVDPNYRIQSWLALESSCPWLHERPISRRLSGSDRPVDPNHLFGEWIQWRERRGRSGGGKGEHNGTDAHTWLDFG